MNDTARRAAAGDGVASLPDENIERHQILTAHLLRILNARARGGHLPRHPTLASHASAGTPLWDWSPCPLRRHASRGLSR